MKAPEISVSKWLNTKENLSLEKLKGKVIAIHAFQMLCPGCILHGVPQAQKLFTTFSEEHLAVLGLHTVFEHHEAMTEVSLKAFLHEFRIDFPVGIDTPGVGTPIPKTMETYHLQGTPSWIIIDQAGDVVLQAFGTVDDMTLGAEICRLISLSTRDAKSIFKQKP